MQESVLEKIGQLGSSFEEITIAKHEPLKCFSLELFPELKSLTNEDCPHFESFCSPNQKIVSLEFLIELILKDCPKLKCLSERMRSLLPALLTLEIIRCPEIEIFSGDGLPLKLQSLTISNCNKLVAGRMHWNLQKLTSLTSFSVKDYEEEEMECFPEVTLLPSVLTSLEICDLPYLKSLNFERLQHFDSLEKLIIKKCRRLRLVPDEGLPSTLTHLEIRDLQNFRFNRRFHDLTRLRELHISNCLEIASLPEEGLPSNLITLELLHLPNLRSVEGLRHLTPLESLIIDSCPHLKTLPEEGLPSSLRQLRIFDWGEIASLPEEGLPLSLISLVLYNLQNLRSVKGLRGLTSLEKLSIWDCPHLKTLSEEGLPSSLSFLEIVGYPLLEKRYRRKKGKCWAKISHIPDIHI